MIVDPVELARTRGAAVKEHELPEPARQLRIEVAHTFLRGLFPT
jgi:hypothetical protein